MPLAAEASLNVPSPLLRSNTLGNRRELPRVAVGAAGAVRRRADEVRFPRPGEIPADIEIEPAVVVVVHERGARRPSRHRGPRRRRHIGERPAAVVAEEGVAAEAGDVQVDVAVVVVVRHGRAEVVARAGQSRPLGHVLELPAAEVAIETIPEARLALVRRPGRGRVRADRRAVGEEQIEPPVAVGVEDRHAAAHRFRQELHAGLRRRVAEA